MVHEGDIAALADCHNSNGDAYVLHESTTPQTTYVAKGCCLEIVIMEAAVTTVPEFPPRLSLLQVYRMYSIWEVRHDILFEMLKSPICRHSTTSRYDKLLDPRLLGPHFGCWGSLLGPYFTKKGVLIGSLSQSLGVLISFRDSELVILLVHALMRWLEWISYLWQL